MPSVDDAYWQNRAGDGRSGCWSRERWLDWEHGTVARRAVSRVWPKRSGVRAIVDVGSGDGEFLAWMAEKFHVSSIGTDMVSWEWKPGPDIPFLSVDAEKLHEHHGLQQFMPDMVTFVNSLAYMRDWKAALESAKRLAPAVLVFDNLIDPTPEWRRATKYANPIPNSELVRWAVQNGMVPAARAAGDVWHRRLFLKTPAWSHPVAALVTAALDMVAAYTTRAEQARHSAWLLVRRGEVLRFRPDLIMPSDLVSR